MSARLAAQWTGQVHLPEAHSGADCLARRWGIL